MTKKVFVSGCYDMLHSGHVAFFEEAASHGDLYVGIGSDATVWELKNRKTVNNEAERLYMVKAIRFVKDAWINSGSGIMDFEKEVIELKPDIFFVNTDGFTPQKEQFCKKHDIQLIVSSRIPHGNLPARSTTALRQDCRIPYRVELCGGWLDQKFVNELCPGSVITISIHPDQEFNNRSGMATSSRAKAVELWQSEIPAGNPIELARTLFCVENPPGKKYISGSQDQLGILLPGLNKLDYDNDFWPVKINSNTDDALMRYIEDKLYLLQLPPRNQQFDVYADVRLNKDAIQRLADAAEGAWNAILSQDTRKWGEFTTKCFEAQLEIFPNMFTPEIAEAVDTWKNTAYGWKLTGAGGGGYLILISDMPIENALKVSIRR